MGRLNRPAYAVGKDRLVYDTSHPVDAGAVQVTVTAESEGIIRRGQIIDCMDGGYAIHAQGGEPCAIAAEDTPYAAEDTELAVPVYISGAFSADRIIAEPELTTADVETLRGKGIYLK